MRKVRTALMIGVFVFALGCSKSDNSEGAPMDDNEITDPNAVSYQRDIRPIMQGNCLSCHGNPPTQNAPMSLTTLNEVKNAIETRGLLSRINSTTSPMPPNGLMPQTARALIAEWANQNFPE
ncbi:hypothetical protein [Muriicola marianensis]|uniref:hypothetical protein n=1 Tax=Muriicola marianensis TaxID=1324801 RepID=UPI001668B9CC|nr:hypothetical protein [Muriicola marianensis]